MMVIVCFAWCFRILPLPFSLAIFLMGLIIFRYFISYRFEVNSCPVPVCPPTVQEGKLYVNRHVCVCLNVFTTISCRQVVVFMWCWFYHSKYSFQIWIYRTGNYWNNSQVILSYCDYRSYFEKKNPKQRKFRMFSLIFQILNKTFFASK